MIAVFIYIVLKSLDYGTVVLGQDSDSVTAAPVPIHSRLMANYGFSRSQRDALKATGLAPAQVDDIERQMVQADLALNPVATRETAVDPMAPSMMAAKSQDVGGIASRPAGVTRGMTARSQRVVDDEKAEATGTMSAAQQDVGGIAAPGSHATLFGAVLRE